MSNTVPRFRILTFNRHEPYMYELAKTGHDFHVLLVDRPPWEKRWDLRSRPVPTNVKIVGEAEDITPLNLDRYDLLLAQSYDDFELVERSRQRKLILLHAVAALPGPFFASPRYRGEARSPWASRPDLAPCPSQTLKIVG